MAKSEQLKNRARQKALQTAVDFADQIEQLDPSERSGYARFINFLLERGCSPSSSCETATLFHLEENDVVRHMDMALKVGLIKERQSKDGSQSGFFIPLLMSATFRQLGFKKDILKIIREHDEFV